MRWWADGGTTAFRVLELIGGLWLLIVAAALAVDHLLHGRKERTALRGPEDRTASHRPTRAPDVIGRAA